MFAAAQIASKVASSVRKIDPIISQAVNLSKKVNLATAPIRQANEAKTLNMMVNIVGNKFGVNKKSLKNLLNTANKNPNFKNASKNKKINAFLNIVSKKYNISPFKIAIAKKVILSL